MRVGFIGVGMMGHGMAKNLIEKGFAATVLGNANRTPIDDLISRGAKEAKSPADIAAVSDVIFLCVPGSPQVEEVIYGPKGLKSAVKSGQIVVDCSTSEPSSTARIHKDLLALSVPFVDAPLARTPREAEAGKLNVMVGAEQEIFTRIKPALETFAENIFHVGGPGAGHTTKLVNNFLAMGQAALIAEALVAGERAGLNLSAFAKVITAGGANSGIFQMIVPRILEDDDTGLPFLLRLAQKDLRYYTNMTESLGMQGPLGGCVHQSFVQAADLGFGDRMVGALVRAQEKINNVKIKTNAVG